MGHDSQVPRDEEMIPLPPELQERKKDSSNPSDSHKKSLAVLADWWAVFGQIYRDDPTELLGVAFRETMKPFPSQIIHNACLRGIRESPNFRPTPGRLAEIAENLLAAQTPGNRPKYLDAPRLSESEREAAVADTPAALRAKLTGKVGA